MNEPRKKRITDKMRLDWIERRGWTPKRYVLSGLWMTPEGDEFKTFRKAIDAAMRKDKR